MLDSGTVRQLAKDCKVYDLSQPVHSAAPLSPNHPPFSLALLRRHGDSVREGGVSGANELVAMCLHSGTHIDALSHISCNGLLHGGLNAQEVQSGGKGMRQLGIETVDPIVCRGVLLDVAGLKGKQVLDPAYEVTPGDLEEACAQHGVTVERGDAVMIRTGWSAYYENVQQFVSEEKGAPGAGLAAAQWLSSRGVRVTGNETISYEVVRPGINERPVHAHLLVDAGVHIMELMNLEELARDRVYEFLFVCSPVRFVGGTGSPIRPLAIV
ncbi:MAG: cyclase family protein [Chloroflexi bacterium]|nr:cyclase family protein [Chloroflexota bacterium]